MSDRAVRAEDAFDVPVVAAWPAAHADPDRAGVDLAAVPCSSTPWTASG